MSCHFQERGLENHCLWGIRWTYKAQEVDGGVNNSSSLVLIKFYGLHSEWASNTSEGRRGALRLLWLLAKGRSGLPKVTGTLLWKWLTDLLHWPQSLGPAASHNPPQLLAVSPPLPRWWPNLEEVVGVESAVAYCRKGPETSNRGFGPVTLASCSVCIVALA